MLSVRCQVSRVGEDQLDGLLWTCIEQLVGFARLLDGVPMRNPFLKPDALQRLPGHPEAARLVPARAQFGRDGADLRRDQFDTRAVEGTPDTSPAAAPTANVMSVAGGGGCAHC